MSSSPRPVLFKVLAYMPTDFIHCLHCERLFEAADIGEQLHREIQTSYPPEMLEEVGRLAAWLQDLSARHGDRLHIRVVDPQSLEGFLLALRYLARSYPAFILNGRKHVGWQLATLERLVEEQVAQNAARDQSQGARSTVWANIRDKVRHLLRVVGEIFYGMTTFDWVRDLRRTRGEVERLFVLITFGDLLGLPILPPYYTLRLLPYVVPALSRWKRSLLRERDWTDLTELIEGVD